MQISYKTPQFCPNPYNSSINLAGIDLHTAPYGFVGSACMVSMAIARWYTRPFHSNLLFLDRNHLEIMQIKHVKLVEIAPSP